MKTLEECRQEIDEIDTKLLSLFEARMQVSKDVILYKLAHDMEIFQPEREKLVIEKSKQKIQQENLKEYGAQLIQSIMDLSKDYQAEFIPEKFEIEAHAPLSKNEMLKVGYQGVEGAFGQEALEMYFSSKVDVKHYDQFEDVFKALDQHEIQYGVVPIENSSTGAINDVYDLIRNYGFYIVGEQSISIAQHLLALPGAELDDIQEVYSHPQGLAQSIQFLDTCPDIRRFPYPNTAMAAKMVMETNDKTKAAIASKKAAELYGLHILKENIHTDKTNHTRFIVIGKQMESNETYNRISIMCSLKHEVGALATILNIIRNHDLNMVRIESRPIHSKPWQYYFYIDFEGNIKDPNVIKALTKMQYNTELLRVLGTYQQS